MLRQEGHIPKEISILPEWFLRSHGTCHSLLFCGVLWRLWRVSGGKPKNLSDPSISSDSSLRYHHPSSFYPPFLGVVNDHQHFPGKSWACSWAWCQVKREGLWKSENQPVHDHLGTYSIDSPSLTKILLEETLLFSTVAKWPILVLFLMMWELMRTAIHF